VSAGRAAALPPLLALGLALLAVACDGQHSGPAPAATDAASPEPAPAQTQPAAARPAPASTPTPVPAAELPIVDLHFHPEPGWTGLDALFDEVGVRMAGNGASGPDQLALDLARRYPGRIVPFGGGDDVRRLVRSLGSRAWEAQDAAVQEFLARLEALLRDGSLRGIGEIHVNNAASNIAGSPVYRYPADSALVRRLFELSARYRVPMSVHMDAEPASVAELERLLASDRGGTLLWAHTGHYADVALIRRLLTAHANLFCELSYRISISGSRSATSLDDRGRLREEWRQLIEDFPDRFVIGTDLGAPHPPSYRYYIGFWRGILEQLSPAAAEKLAYVNAERLLRAAR